jgi:hypothetical protein
MFVFEGPGWTCKSGRVFCLFLNFAPNKNTTWETIVG